MTSFKPRKNTLEFDMWQTVRENLKVDEIEYGRIATNKHELREITYDITGLWVPDKAVCENHDSPLDAFWTAYHAEHPVVVWKASRGLGGKSVLLAALTMVEAVSLGASANLLGGSGEQSQRVHDYMTGEDTNLPDKFWKWRHAPNYLLSSSPTKRETKLLNHGRIKTLMASQRSVRGPHPQRLRLDEVDEMDFDIFEAALGQPLAARGIADQTVASSTHQNPDGTMTKILQRAMAEKWPVFEWCYKESMEGWLTTEMVQRKRSTISAAMWEVEFDLQEPSPTSRAILPDKVEDMFDGDNVIELLPGEELRIEQPLDEGEYLTGADWAKEHDNTVIVTIRTDVRPVRVVAFQYVNRRPWPDMARRFDQRITDYGGNAAHDATGLGNVVNDLIVTDAYPVVMTGRNRKDMFSNYIAGIEAGKIVSPRIMFMYSEHKYCKVADLYGRGHPPDSIVATSMAWKLHDMGWVA